MGLIGIRELDESTVAIRVAGAADKYGSDKGMRDGSRHASHRDFRCYPLAALARCGRSTGGATLAGVRIVTAAR